MMSLDDCPSWAEQLEEAARTKWSGQVVLFSGREQVGCVVFSAGRVAWAVCKYQPEDLGTFLKRIGKVDKRQLEIVRREFARHRGERKLGALLEEAGCLNRPMLRRCLMLHIRMAIGCLMRSRQLTPVHQTFELSNDDDLTFNLAELTARRSLLPMPHEDSGRFAMPLLEDLADLAGYRASLIVDSTGRVVASHVFETGIEAGVVGVKLATLTEAAVAMASSTGLGDLSWLITDCCEGALLTTWVDRDRGMVAAVLLSGEGNIGMVKYRLAAALERFLAGIDASTLEAMNGEFATGPV